VSGVASRWKGDRRGGVEVEVTAIGIRRETPLTMLATAGTRPRGWERGRSSSSFLSASAVQDEGRNTRMLGGRR